jgi:hypothetical protein
MNRNKTGENGRKQTKKTYDTENTEGHPIFYVYFPTIYEHTNKISTREILRWEQKSVIK